MTFRAPRWLPNRHAQTVFGAMVRLPISLPLSRQRWELPDGDFLDIDRLDGPSADAPVVVVCHGLEGSSRAGYVRGLMRELMRHRLGAVAINFRGCSGELNRLPRFYHSGETGDLAFVVDKLLAERPGRALGLAGFSLGGNVVAKFMGERGDALPPEVRAGAVVSVPFDLSQCCDALDGPGVMAWVYRERFLRRLRAKVAAKARRVAGLDPAGAFAARNLRDFDDRVTAPLHGFAGAADYYERSSSAQFLPAVRRPLFILAAADDPFIPAAAIPRAQAKANPRLMLEEFEAGGHVAFVHGPPWSPRRYAERRVADVLAQHLR